MAPSNILVLSGVPSLIIKTIAKKANLCPYLIYFNDAIQKYKLFLSLAFGVIFIF